MRQAIIGVLLAIFGPLAAIWLERAMATAPEWLWGLLKFGCIVAGLAIVGLSDPVYGYFRDSQRHPVLSSLLLGLGFFIAASAGWYFGFPYLIKSNDPSSTTHIQGPIQWKFDVNSPIAHSRRYGEPLWILGFFIKGKNISDDPLSSVTAYIRSDVTNERVDLDFVHRGSPVPTKNFTVPPHGDFQLTKFLPSSDQRYTNGMVLDSFRVAFRRFTLVFECNGTQYVKHFSEQEVFHFLSVADRATREALDKSGHPVGIVPNKPKKQ